MNLKKKSRKEIGTKITNDFSVTGESREPFHNIEAIQELSKEISNKVVLEKSTESFNDLHRELQKKLDEQEVSGKISGVSGWEEPLSPKHLGTSAMERKNERVRDLKAGMKDHHKTFYQPSNPHILEHSGTKLNDIDENLESLQSLDQALNKMAYKTAF